MANSKILAPHVCAAIPCIAKFTDVQPVQRQPNHKLMRQHAYYICHASQRTFLEASATAPCSHVLLCKKVLRHCTGPSCPASTIVSGFTAALSGKAALVALPPLSIHKRAGNAAQYAGMTCCASRTKSCCTAHKNSNMVSLRLPWCCCICHCTACTGTLEQRRPPPCLLYDRPSNDLS